MKEDKVFSRSLYRCQSRLHFTHAAYHAAARMLVHKIIGDQVPERISAFIAVEEVGVDSSIGLLFRLQEILVGICLEEQLGLRGSDVFASIREQLLDAAARVVRNGETSDFENDGELEPYLRIVKAFDQVYPFSPDRGSDEQVRAHRAVLMTFLGHAIRRNSVFLATPVVVESIERVAKILIEREMTDEEFVGLLQHSEAIKRAFWFSCPPFLVTSQGAPPL